MTQYMMPSGTMTAKNTGVLYEIVTTVPRTLNTHWYNILIVDGRLLSIVSMSRENLFTILPMGVVSKNDMGDLRTFSSNLKWRVPAAVTIRAVAIKENARTKMPVNTKELQK